MSRVKLIGGPLDGKYREVSRKPPDFVFAAPREGRVDSPVRLFQTAAEDRFLYRREDSQRATNIREDNYLYAGHRYARCCGGYHRRDDDGNLTCTVCGAELYAER